MMYNWVTDNAHGFVMESALFFADPCPRAGGVSPVWASDFGELRLVIRKSGRAAGRNADGSTTNLAPPAQLYGLGLCLPRISAS
eukprot:scaffold85992_cov63-Phaeocystis_antarctica.AAC.11